MTRKNENRGNYHPAKEMGRKHNCGGERRIDEYMLDKDVYFVSYCWRDQKKGGKRRARVAGLVFILYKRMGSTCVLLSNFVFVFVIQ